MVGAYLAFSYLFLASGVMVSGYVVEHYVASKRLIIRAGIVCLPLTLMMGWVESVELLVPLTSLLWFLGGMAFSALNSLASDLTPSESRGAYFSLLAMASPLGAIVGGLISGPIVDQWNYQALFIVMTGVSLLWPLSIWLLDTTPLTSASVVSNLPVSGTASLGDKHHRLSTNTKLLLFASLLAFIANFIGILGVSLSMDELGFNATEISSTAVIGGLVALPFIYGIGRLSDLLGRKLFWITCCVSGLVALWALPVANNLWHFWCVALLLRIFSTGNRGIGSAWVVDLSNGINSPKLIALFGTTTWVGGILGYLITGYGLLYWGGGITFSLALTFPLLAILFVIPLNAKRK